MKKPFKHTIDIESLKKLLSYDKDTGKFTWTKDAHFKVRGKEAGYINRKFGYIRIGVLNKVYQAHRLAWIYHYGVNPEQQVDHINGDKTDNRIKNLRLATTAQNQMNCKAHCDNSTGFKGVTYRKGLKKPYRAAVQTCGKMIHVGYFSTPKEASIAYYLKAREIFGEFASQG